MHANSDQVLAHDDDYMPSRPSVRASPAARWSSDASTGVVGARARNSPWLSERYGLSYEDWRHNNAVELRKHLHHAQDAQSLAEARLSKVDAELADERAATEDLRARLEQQQKLTKQARDEVIKMQQQSARAATDDGTSAALPSPQPLPSPGSCIDGHPHDRLSNGHHRDRRPHEATWLEEKRKKVAVWGTFSCKVALLHVLFLHLVFLATWTNSSEKADRLEVGGLMIALLLSWFAGQLWGVDSQDRVAKDPSFRSDLKDVRQASHAEANDEFFTVRELWKFTQGEESAYEIANAMGIFGSDADFTSSAISVLVVAACQISLIALLLRVPRLREAQYMDESDTLHIDFADDHPTLGNNNRPAQSQRAFWDLEDKDVNERRYGLFFDELICYISTGVVILVFVFQDVIEGLKLVSFNARIAYLKLSYQAKAPIRVFVGTRTLQSPDVIDEEEEGEPMSKSAEALPSWSRTVVLVGLAWVRIAVGLIITEYCVRNVRNNFRELEVGTTLTTHAARTRLAPG